MLDHNWGKNVIFSIIDDDEIIFYDYITKCARIGKNMYKNLEVKARIDFFFKFCMELTKK